MSTLSTTKIDMLLLGLLQDRPMHGYELYQQVQSEGIDAWFNVSMAGVYYSLGKLRDQGLVVEARQQGSRSARRSIYHLTKQGRSAFFAAMEQQAVKEEKVQLDYDVIIYLLNRLPVERAITLLAKHRAFLSEQARKVRDSLAAERQNGSSPLGLAVLDHRLRYLEMEGSWLADVIRDIQGDGKEGDETANDHGGLMILSGDLRHYHLPDLIHLIVLGKHSGTLSVTDGVVSHTLGFQEGQPVCAACLQSGEAPMPRTSSQDVLEGLCDLFRWQEGKFTLDQRMGRQEWCVPVELSAEELILGGCRRVDDWAIIQRLVPSTDAIFELGTTSQRLEELTLTKTEKQIVTAVDGIKDVAAIAREVGLTVFEASRAVYCLAAAGIVRSANLDKIRLRRVFREIAELMCNSTLAWRRSPEDRTYEDEVNRRCEQLPLCLNRGRIEDQADPQLRTDELVEMYSRFLSMQLSTVSQHFGRENARQSFERTLRQLAPELQDVAKRFGFDRLPAA